jgi:hypothetical protein
MYFINRLFFAIVFCVLFCFVTNIKAGEKGNKDVVKQQIKKMRALEKEFEATIKKTNSKFAGRPDYIR